MSGNTSTGGLQRLDYWLSRPIHVFILELGINDFLRGISPATTYRNLKMIVEKVRSKFPGVAIALMGMELPSFVPGSVAGEFRSIFSNLSEEYGIAYVPFFLEGVAGKQHLNLPDGLHPSAAGYAVITEKVWPVIKLLLFNQ